MIECGVPVLNEVHEARDGSRLAGVVFSLKGPHEVQPMWTFIIFPTPLPLFFLVTSQLNYTLARNPEH